MHVRSKAMVETVVLADSKVLVLALMGSTAIFKADTATAIRKCVCKRVRGR